MNAIITDAGLQLIAEGGIPVDPASFGLFSQVTIVSPANQTVLANLQEADFSGYAQVPATINVPEQGQDENGYNSPYNNASFIADGGLSTPQTINGSFFQAGGVLLSLQLFDFPVTISTPGTNLTLQPYLELDWIP